MKKYNIKRLVKIKLNIVGADASVRLEKNQNRNNIRTFVKSKSNAVGVGVPDDPKEKYKFANKPLSNDILKDYSTFLRIEKDNKTGRRGRRPLQMPKTNFGITLIALIITIIILLILAGVTLNMVMGDSGIFGKANNAKNKTEVAQYEEELRMCVLELQTDAAANGTTFNMDTIKNKFVEKVKELENTTEIEFPTEESETKLDGIYKGYKFYIDDKYAAHIGDKATGISLTTSLEPSGWTQGPVTATITIKSNNGINNVEPDEGSKNGNNEYIITKENIAENTSFQYTVTDGQGNTQTKTAVINTIDKNAPADFTITAENTEEGLKITGDTKDTESGIDKYEYYAKKSDGEYKAYDSNPITGLASGTYSVYAIAYDKAGNKKQSTNTVENVKISRTYSDVTAQMVAEHPETYYGLKVTNYESQNGQNDWKIFYSDGTHIFLITGDYINTAETNRINTTATGMTTSSYSAYWASNSVPAFQTVDSTTLTRFKATEYALQSGINNSKCVSTLLNDNNWSSYKDSGSKAEKAIGSPTVEMWMDSWNARYPKSSDKIYRKASTSTSNPGYYVGTGQNPTTTYIDSSVMSAKEGYNNKLYYPYTLGYNGTNGYWLASPSAYSSNYVLLVAYYGDVNSYYYTNIHLGVRPVVSLNSGITVNAEDAE